MTGATHPTDAAVIRTVAEQVVDAAWLKVSQEHADTRKMSIPAPLQWAGGIAAGIMAFVMTGFIGWAAFTLSDLKETVARIDERQKAQTDLPSQVDALERRVSLLESYHREKGK